MFKFFGHKAGEILAPWPGIKLTPPCIGRQSLNHWTTRNILRPWMLTTQHLPDLHGLPRGPLWGDVNVGGWPDQIGAAFLIPKTYFLSLPPFFLPFLPSLPVNGNCRIRCAVGSGKGRGAAATLPHSQWQPSFTCSAGLVPFLESKPCLHYTNHKEGSCQPLTSYVCTAKGSEKQWVSSSGLFMVCELSIAVGGIRERGIQIFQNLLIYLPLWPSFCCYVATTVL